MFFTSEEFIEYNIAPNVPENGNTNNLNCSNILKTMPFITKEGRFPPRSVLVGHPGSGNSWIR